MICNYKLCHWIQYYLLHPYFSYFSSFPVIFFHLLLFWRVNCQFSCLFAFKLHPFDCVIFPWIAFATWGLRRGKQSPRWYFKNNLARLHALFYEVTLNITNSFSEVMCPMPTTIFNQNHAVTLKNFTQNFLALFDALQPEKMLYFSFFCKANLFYIVQFLSVVTKFLYSKAPIKANNSTVVTIFKTDNTTLAIDRLKMLSAINSWKLFTSVFSLEITLLSV